MQRSHASRNTRYITRSLNVTSHNTDDNTVWLPAKLGSMTVRYLVFSYSRYPRVYVPQYLREPLNLQGPGAYYNNPLAYKMN